jgi:hypothetical protein
MTASNGIGSLTVVFRLNIASANGPNQKPFSDSYTYRATFNPSEFSVIRSDSAPYTATNYVVSGNGAISSDIFSLMPSEALTTKPDQTIIGRQNDYDTDFIKNIGFGDNRTFEVDGVLNQTVTEMFFERREPSRGGTGDAASAMTPAEVHDILQVGCAAPFFIFHRVYDGAQTRTTYEGTATILSVSPMP